MQNYYFRTQSENVAHMESTTWPQLNQKQELDRRTAP